MASKLRTRSGHIGVWVNVDIEDVLEELTDDDVRELAEERGIIKTAPKTNERDDTEALIDELWATFLAQDRTHFRVLLARMEPPRQPTARLKKKHPELKA